MDVDYPTEDTVEATAVDSRDTVEATAHDSRSPSDTNDDIPYAGQCYYDCRRGYCLAIGIVIGVAFFAGMIALIFSESDSETFH